jgi:hypothetical protein
LELVGINRKMGASGVGAAARGQRARVGGKNAGGITESGYGGRNKTTQKPQNFLTNEKHCNQRIATFMGNLKSEKMEGPKQPMSKPVPIATASVGETKAAIRTARYGELLDSVDC